MENQYDVIVIGSGPGGYTAAIRASHLGYKVAVVEKYSSLGGTCTNVGCVPAKALLDSSEHYHRAKEEFKTHGIELDNGVSLNFAQFIRRKDDAVSSNVSGLGYLLKKNKIDVHSGRGQFLDSNRLTVYSKDGEILLRGKYFIIATGSKPLSIPGVTVDKQRIMTSTHALSLQQQPKSLVIIGGGVIGVETASIFARIGTEVTIIEHTGSLIPEMDRELGKALFQTLYKLNVKILLSSQVRSAVNLANEVCVNYLDKDANKQVIISDYCLVAVGRRAYTEGLNLQAAGVDTEKNGKVKVNDQFQTTSANIYAIGDVINGPMLAHKAEDEGVIVAEVINGKKNYINNYNFIPRYVYTFPEIASVGATEEELKANGIEYRSGKFPYSASGLARADIDSESFVKVLISPKYGEVLGLHIIGPRAADVVAQSVVGMEYKVTVEDMYRISYAHPTYSEALKDACLLALGQETLNI